MLELFNLYRCFQWRVREIVKLQAVRVACKANWANGTSGWEDEGANGDQSSHTYGNCSCALGRRPVTFVRRLAAGAARHGRRVTPLQLRQRRRRNRRA